MESFKVRIWSLKKRTDAKGFQLRWFVGDRPQSASFDVKAMGDAYRSRLVAAKSNGEPFDTETGEPISWRTVHPAPETESETESGPSCYDLALKYVDMKWPHAAGKSRSSIAESLAVIIPALTEEVPGRPSSQALRDALYLWAFNVIARNTEPSASAAKAIAWIERASIPVADLAKGGTARRGLEAISVLKNGRPASAKTFVRKRATYTNFLNYAVELEYLPANPLARIRWTPEKVDGVVDPRVVASPKQVRAILAAVREHDARYVAFFACMYFGFMRPAEVVRLKESQCTLPAKGWGRLDLEASAPRAGAQWTDDGNAHEDRSLKHRSKQTVRPVPIPPELVTLLREHLDQFGTAPDGRLFRSRRAGAGMLSESTFGTVWKNARAKALGEKATTKLARRPYDLRHAGISLALSAGLDPAEIAERAGNSVKVLLDVYAKCIDGKSAAQNKKIDGALAADDDAGDDATESE